MSSINTSCTTATERRIARDLIAKALLAGYSISIWEGEDYAIRDSRDQGAIEAALASTGYDHVELSKDGRHVGSVMLVWGNDEDLIADCHQSVANLI